MLNLMSKIPFQHLTLDTLSGSATWNEDQRGNAKDHTSPPQQNAGTATGSAGLAEVIMLGCMPVREDYEVWVFSRQGHGIFLVQIHILECSSILGGALQ